MARIIHAVFITLAISWCSQSLAQPPWRVANTSLIQDGNWGQFSDISAASNTSLDAANVKALRNVWRVELPESVDGSPVFARAVDTPSGRHDLLIVSTQAGRLVALDAASGDTIWSADPPAGPRWTTSSPAIDPDGQFVYAYGLDGQVHKRLLATGEEVAGDGWPQLITRKPSVEKGSSALSIATTRNGSNYLYMTIAAYPDPGDDGDYQGHLVTIDLRTGNKHVFNAACSDKEMLFVENGDSSSDCANVQSGIWARAGAVYDSRTDRVYVTTGNGVFDGDSGGYNWGTSVLALSPDGSPGGGTPLDSYTPTNHQFLTDMDLDLSSTTVTALLLPDGSTLPPLAVQGGKDGRVRLLNLADLSGRGGPGHLGGELQIVDPPQWGEILTRPAVWTDGTTSYVAVANDEGITTYSLQVTPEGGPLLVQRWYSEGGATSPVYANGILYCIRSRELFALDASSGEVLWSDPSVDLVHWQSPIVIDDRLFVADARAVSAYKVVSPHPPEVSSRRRIRVVRP